jgi:hypothetical protein
MLSALILGCIDPWSDILAMLFPISCCIPVFDLQLVPEQAGLSQVFPSQTLLPQVSGVHVVEAIDILPSDIDMVASVTDIDASDIDIDASDIDIDASDIDIDASDIDISEVIDCDAFPDAIVSSLLGNLPNAATEAPRTKTLATPNQTF